MSAGFNTAFQGNIRTFITQHFITGVRIQGKDSITNLKPNAFDLKQHVFNGYQIITLDIFNTSVPVMSGRGLEAPISAYWVPQGGYCIIPFTPHPNSLSTFVFTPDFSGCSILVDQITPDKYCVYHVQGGSNYLNKEYLDIRINHGLGLAGYMIFDDYGINVAANVANINNVATRAFAFLKHEQGRWWIYYQSQNGVGIGYNGGQFRAVGQQTVRGGGKIPIADLRREVSRTPPRINGVIVQTPRYHTHIQRFGRSRLPDNTTWGL